MAVKSSYLWFWNLM